MTLTPQQMPTVRDQMRTHWHTTPKPAGIYAPVSNLGQARELTEKEGTACILDISLGHKERGLYWVASEMQQVAEEAAGGTQGLTLDSLPEPAGILGFEVGFPVPGSSPRLLIDCVAWSAREVGEGRTALTVALRGSREDGDRWIGTLLNSYGFHSPGQALSLPPLSERTREWDQNKQDLAEFYDRLQRVFHAAIELMQIPTVAEVKKMPVPAKVAKKRAKKGRVDPEVRIVTLRPMRNENVTHSPSGRKYHHRWLVRGHWRNQACGPKQSERKRTWVPSYTKGPDGAPLIGGDLVKVWKR